MCGIAGIVRTDGAAVDVGLVAQMTERLRHRGPDDEGYVLGTFPDGTVTPAAGNDTVPPLRATLPALDTAAASSGSLVFGHRRLAIIDCTPAGHQPMGDASGALWVVYNGEIYNYLELRAELEQKGHTFSTHSDTEVLLAAYAEWGLACLGRFNGMWAFCLWDRRRRWLFCARDRFGVKPFYYRHDEAAFAFASEIKALLPASPTPPAINEALAYDYLAFDFLDHTPETMIAGIRQLPPAHWLTLDERGQLTVQRYYTLPYTSAGGRADDATIEPLAGAYRELLVDAVRLRLRTDVPLGSCLSGGLDSSSIVCAISRLFGGDHSAAQQRTFTAAYDDPACDERRFAEQVAAAARVQATYVFPSAGELWNEILALTWHQDEPFGSTSIYAQWCVMRAARRGGVTVMLDGQGGDELLAGYTMYHPILLKGLLCRAQLKTLRNEIRAGAQRLGQSPWRLTGKAAAVFYEPLRRFLPAAHGSDLLSGDFARRHRRRRAGWRAARSTTNLQARLWADMVQFSIPQLLHYEDRNSMAFSVEARLPFLDYRLVEWAFAQPAAVKLHAGWTKYIARKAVAGLCPESIAWRTDKVGFATPEAAWMHAGGEVLRLLSDPGTFRAGRFIDPLKLRAAMLPNDEPAPRWRRDVWRATSFELWMRLFGIS